MKKVSIRCDSLTPNARTKVVIGRHDYNSTTSGLVFIMQADRPNTLILVERPTSIDISATVRQAVKAKDAKTFGGKIADAVAEWFK